MATVESVTNEVKALAASLKAQARDKAEAALLLFVAGGALQREQQLAQQENEEAKAELVLQARAALQGGKTVVQQKDEIAAQMKIRTEELKAVDAIGWIRLKEQDPEDEDEP